MNYVLLSFSFFTSIIILGSSLLNTLESKLPTIFVNNFRYGKFGMKNKVSKITVEVPKAWFKHMYMLAIYIFGFTFYLVTCIYVFNSDVPNWFIQLLNITCGHDRVATSKYIC